MSEERNTTEDDMREEYDLTSGDRGRYAERYSMGTNLVLLEPDVAAVFPDSESVNEALRLLIRIARESGAGS